MARKQHHPPHEEHPDETWLVPYADLLTLLLALFIVLFATSKVDSQKFAQIAYAMQQALANPLSTGGGSSILNSGGGPGIIPGVGSGPSSAGMSPEELESAQLANARQQIESFIKDEHMELELETVLADQGLMVRVRDNALFASGSAQLFPNSMRLAGVVANALAKIPQNILISGHTDNIPINTAQYPSNWELSSARAISLMKAMLAATPGLQPGRMSAIGFGEYRPVAPNNTEEGRAKNRRVEILIQRHYIRGEKVENSLINPSTSPTSGAAAPTTP